VAFDKSRQNGLTENDGRENDGPSKWRDTKLAQKRQTLKEAEYIE